MSTPRTFRPAPCAASSADAASVNNTRGGPRGRPVAFWETPDVELHPQAQAVLDHIASFGFPPITEVSPVEARKIRRAHIQPSAIELHEIRDVDAGGVPLGFTGRAVTTASACSCTSTAGAGSSGPRDARLDVSRPRGRERTRGARRRLPARARASLSRCARRCPGGDTLGVIARRRARLRPRQARCRGRLGRRQPRCRHHPHGTVPLRFQLLVYPVTDAATNTTSYADFANGPYLTRASMDWYIAHYLSGDEGAADDPRVSPLLGDDEALAKSPPTHVVTVETDVLRDEGEAYAARLIRSACRPTCELRGHVPRLLRTARADRRGGSCREGVGSPQAGSGLAYDQATRRSSPFTSTISSASGSSS